MNDIKYFRFSVLQSVYKKDNPRYLDIALKSIADNTILPIEVILVKDGTLTNDLEAVIETWRSKLPLDVVGYEQNHGLDYALNYGLKFVSTPLVARMDSDDICDSKRFEREVKFLDEHPDIDIVGGSIQEFDKHNDCLNVRRYPQTPDECRRYIVKASPLAHPSVMMRYSIFSERGLSYDSRYKLNEDVKLWFDAILSGCKIANIPDIVLFYRCSDGMFNRRSSVKAKNELKAYMNGIYRMHGIFTLDYIYPIARYIFRNMPTSFVKFIYKSGFRKKLLQ